MEPLLWQHKETGRYCWSDNVIGMGEKWQPVPTMYEDELPTTISKSVYDDWYANSEVVHGVRMGYRI
jgi:hypothetical protein